MMRTHHFRCFGPYSPPNSIAAFFHQIANSDGAVCRIGLNVLIINVEIADVNARKMEYAIHGFDLSFSIFPPNALSFFENGPSAGKLRILFGAEARTESPASSQAKHFDTVLSTKWSGSFEAR